MAANCTSPGPSLAPSPGGVAAYCTSPGPSLAPSPGGVVAYRTSPRQAEIMIAFMEKHGDLNRTGSRGLDRLEQYRLWAALHARLEAANQDHLHARSLDKWKKAWSDMKNNIKKKAARIAQQGPPRAGCAPLRLSQLEVRVLSLTGMIKKAASSCPVPSLRRLTGRGAGTPRLPPLAALPCPPPLKPAPLPPLEAIDYDTLDDADPLSVIKTEGEEDFSWPEEPSPRSPARAMEEVEREEHAEEGEVDREEHAEDGEEEREEYTAEETAPVRPDDRGNTTTRGVRVRGARGAGLERALAALLRAERRRARGEARARARRRALHRDWQALARRGLGLLERLLDRPERSSVPAPPAADPWRPLHPDPRS